MPSITITESYDAVMDYKDSTIDTWPFMQSPVPVMSILATYLYFVLKLGPKMMEKKKPYELKTLLIAYNALQVIFSIFLCWTCLNANSFSILFNFNCKSSLAAKDEIAVAAGGWWYFIAKISELLDTVFFVLRKKQNQVTFLHVYHHSIMMAFSWVYLKYLPGEQAVPVGLINSFVHVIMYTYYLIAAMGPKYQKYIWWKRYMTVLQLVQFVMLLTYFISTIVMDCKLSKSVSFFFMTNIAIFLFLFLDFYIKTYRVKPKCKTVSEKIKSI